MTTKETVTLDGMRMKFREEVADKCAEALRRELDDALLKVLHDRATVVLDREEPARILVPTTYSVDLFTWRGDHGIVHRSALAAQPDEDGVNFLDRDTVPERITITSVRDGFTDLAVFRLSSIATNDGDAIIAWEYESGGQHETPPPANAPDAPTLYRSCNDRTLYITVVND